MYFGVSFRYASGPDGLILVLGTISSSGVTKAIYEYWQYYEPIRIYGPQKCVKLTQKLVNVMDNIFAKHSNTTQPAEELKALFGLEGVEYVQDSFTSYKSLSSRQSDFRSHLGNNVIVCAILEGQRRLRFLDDSFSVPASLSTQRTEVALRNVSGTTMTS